MFFAIVLVHPGNRKNLFYCIFNAFPIFLYLGLCDWFTNNNYAMHIQGELQSQLKEAVKEGMTEAVLPLLEEGMVNVAS